MKFTMTTALVVALAAVSSAGALPAKFTLRSTTTTPGTPLEKYLGQITVDSYVSRSLNIGPGSNQNQVPILAIKAGDSSAYINTSELGIWDLSVDTEYSNELQFVPRVSPRNWPKTGFSELNGALVFNLGSGPKALWSACPNTTFKNLWNVYWSPPATLAGCIPIGLTIVPL